MTLPEFGGMIEGLAAYLAAQSWVATYTDEQSGLGAGTLFFKGRMPDTPDIAVGIYEMGGGPSQRVRDALDLGVEQPAIYVAVRGVTETYPQTRALAELVYETVAAIDNQNMSDRFWLWLQPLHPPIDVGRDTKERPMFGMHFRGQATPAHA